MFLLVALPSFMNTPVTYLAPGQDCLVGMRVKVPFGRSQKIGIVIEHQDTCDLPREKIKPIIDVLDTTPVFLDCHLDFLKRLAKYYQHSINLFILAALPSYLHKNDFDCDPIFYQVAPSSSTQKITSVQSEILSASETPTSLFSLLSQYRAQSIHALIDEKRLVPCVAEHNKPNPKPQLPILSPAQKDCLKYLQQPKPLTKVFWGITGCGKTEVYSHLIANTLKQNQQVLILVPEIALTPQTVQKIASRIGFEPTILHSNQPPKLRALNWLNARHALSSVIIGTRSAILCPIPNLGLIIVDEEHSESYRQDTPFFYSARDAAILRANMLNIPIHLGSATPSLESMLNVEHKKYGLYRLFERFNASPPNIQLVPLEPHQVIAPSLIGIVQKTLDNNHHVMLFIGKRGFSRVSSCQSCGFQHRCEGCDRLLVSHTDQKMHCHHCNITCKKIIDCPKCHQSELSHWGIGSQSLTSHVETLWPNVPNIRIDTDNLTNQEAANTLNALSDQPATIIVGTQMITKGHDIDRLNTVIVINSDYHLYSPDFRSEEKLYCELIQVAGRSGRRNTQGAVYIQTQSPNHPLYQNLGHIEQGYAYLFQKRKQFNLPPYHYMACLFIRGKPNHLKFLQQFRLPSSDSCDVMGPIAFPSGKRRGLECYKIMITSSNRSARDHYLRSLKLVLSPKLNPSISLVCQVDSHLAL
ncbi:MAG: primosomal protein N' [Pseudomonadota bacterium]|nr:primosomal protein N' [Pseudomonadota bacterium]